MSNINHQSGWRKATFGLAVAEQHAHIGEQVAVPKVQAFVAVKRVGAHIGLKAGDILLLDMLGAFTQAQDWEEGRRPIVWTSNAYLMEQTGFSLSALKRHARRLVETGVIAFKDSSNGKRWGRRDAEGAIVEAYGFDLSPLSARAEEFEQLHAELQVERELCQRLKRQITVSRRMIRARIEAALSGALKGPWTQLSSLFKDLLARLPFRDEASERLERYLAWFKELQERVEAAFLKATCDAHEVENIAEITEQMSEKTQKMNPRGVNSDPHILITNQLNPVNSNCFENKAAAREEPEKQPPNEIPDKTEGIKSDCDLDGIRWSTNRPRDGQKTEVELSTVMASCPEFAKLARGFVGGYVKTWDDLHRAAGMLRPMVGISEDAWTVAQQKLSPLVAAAALALIYDKTSNGEVVSAGGYLRGMVVKALAGKLHLERSFYGRLSGAGGVNR